MSALNLKSVKRNFSELNYRPDVCHPSLINELKNILEATGLRQEYDTALTNINSHLLINIIRHVCKICYSDVCNKEMVVNFLNFLSKVYTEHCIDDAVKNTVTKCLKLCPEIWKSELSIAISCQFVSKMKNKQNLSETEYFLKTLNECTEKFPDFILNCIDKVMVFFELNLRRSHEILVCESCPTQKISAIRCIHESFRFFLTAYKRNIFPETMNFSFNACFVDLLDSDNLPMETLFNCCLSIVYSLIKDKSTLECWKMCLEKLSTRSDLIKLGFCMAILNTFTGEELRTIEPGSGKSICVNLYNIIMETSIRNLNDSSILISSSRVLVVFSKQLLTKSKIDIEKNQIERLITFLWIRLDHFIDSVRHSARDAMINIIKIKDEYVLDNVLNCLSICDKNSKAFCIVLSIISDKVNSGSIIKYLPSISETLIHLMTSNNSAITIFINLMLNHYKITESKLWFDYWLHPLLKKTDVLDIKYFKQIITKAVELTPDVSKYIYELSDKNELSLKIYLIYLNIEKKMYLKNNDDRNWMSQTNIETLKKALHNNDENIRFIAVNIILECQKKTQPFTDKELDLMKYFIIYNIKTEKPSIRQTNLSFVKKTLVRMNESQFSVSVKNDESLNSKLQIYYTEFQHWFSNFCFQNLFYDANFFRRNFSLESLRLIQTYLVPTGIIGLNESNNFSVVLNCIWDTYEQNKILAKDILTYNNQELVKLDNIKIKDMLKTSKILASSTSPPDSITAGYLLEIVIFLKHGTNYEESTYDIILDLLDDLKKEVELAEENLTLASGKGPMYGLIHTIRHLLKTLNWQNHSLKDNWTTFIENLSKTCFKCEKLVSVVVNDSSPEGIIPMDDLYQNDCQVTSQMVLLCCWRTTKESSLLLADIVSIIETQDSDFSNALITQICSCLTLLLSETKHRGAFEQIYVAYLKVCSIMWKSPTLYKIPLRYLEDVLTEIKTGLGESFCVTRRSAGMPFIIQALICTNHDKRKNVSYTMETLISICENKNINEDLKVGVVHALNVLRVLFRCSQLGDLVGPFVSRAIGISIVLFNSSSWPIRNSSTLLLSALVNRVFGVPRSSTEISWKNRMTGREFFQRYPELYDTFLNEFKKFSPMDMRPSLYPTLLILARLYPTLNEATDCIFQLAVYIPYIFKCAQSPVMKTRMLAATSITPQVTQNKLVEHLHITYNELITKHLKENTTHGLLLQMFSLVKNLPKLDDFDELVSLTEDLIKNYDQFINCSYVVQEVFLRCITCLWLQLDDVQYNNSVKQFCTLTLESITKLAQSNAIGRSKYLESAILLLFAISLKAQTDFSIVVYNIMNNKIHCETIFKILGFILSENPIEFCDVDLDNFKNLNWDRKVLTDQLMTNKSLMELVCQQCTIVDKSIDMKYLVLSKFTPALHMYFKIYDSIDYFISKLFNITRDSEITQALSCINGYLYTQTSLNQFVIKKLTHLFDIIYNDQRSDECKNACIDIIFDHYNLLIRSKSIDSENFLKLWNVIIHYSEDNSEEVRNHVWRLVNKDANCTKSFELLFDKFAEHFEQFPSAVLIALIYWSYLDVDLPQDRPEGQVFDGEDTSEFKEHTIRRDLALNIIISLTNNNPQSINLEISKYLQEWIIEEWTTDFCDKPTVLNIKTVGDFMNYAKNVHLITSKLFCLKLTN